MSKTGGPTGAPCRGPGPAGRRLPTLTGLRFVAALAVFLFHLSLYAPFSGPASGRGASAFAARNLGGAGVSFFFVLSGFVLTWSARAADGYGGFVGRRLAKIVPNHVVTFAAAVGYFALCAPGAVGAAQGLPNLLLLHASAVERPVAQWYAHRNAPCRPAPRKEKR